MKFLRARRVPSLSPPRIQFVLIELHRDLVVANAKTMLISTLKWRVEFKADDLVNEQFPEDVFGNLGHIFGKDKEGRPVTYVLS